MASELECACRSTVGKGGENCFGERESKKKVREMLLMKEVEERRRKERKKI